VAPEQRLRREAGPAGDQYALATLVYTCLSGAPPLVEDPMMAIAGGRTPEPAPRLDQVRADIPAWVSRAVERAMSRAPDARYPTARDFVLALETPPTPPVSGRALALGGYEALGRHPGHRLNWRWVPAGLLTLVALGAVLAPWLLSSRPATDGRVEADTGSVARASAESLALAAVVPDSHAPALSPPGPLVPAAPPAPAERAPVSTQSARRPTNAPPRRVTPAPRPARRTDAAAERVGASGHLFVNATPWGQVYVDGDLVGNTPQVGVPVSPGAHRLRVVRDGFEPYEVAIHIAPGQELRLTDIVLREQRP